METQPYLFFEGRCDEAIAFYRKAVGAEVTMLMHYKDSPDPQHCAGIPPDKVMHASFKIGGTVVNASDGRCTGKAEFKGFALSIAAGTDDEAHRLFAALCDGGQVMMPMGKTFFASSFGMVTDKFGVMWMVIVPTIH